MDFSTGTLLGQFLMVALFLAAALVVIRGVSRAGAALGRIADALTRIADQKESDRSHGSSNADTTTRN